MNQYVALLRGIKAQGLLRCCHAFANEPRRPSPDAVDKEADDAHDATIATTITPRPTATPINTFNVVLILLRLAFLIVAISMIGIVSVTTWSRCWRTHDDSVGRDLLDDHVYLLAVLPLDYRGGCRDASRRASS